MSNHNLIAATNMKNDLENPLLSNHKHSNSSIFTKITNAIYGLLYILFFISLLALVIIYLAATIVILFRYLQTTKSDLNSVFISSFNVSTNSTNANWDVKLSLNHPGGNFENFEARSWLYFENGLVSMARISSSSVYYDFPGQGLVVHANFIMQLDNIEDNSGLKTTSSTTEDYSWEGSVILDLMIEANVTYKPDTFGLTYLEYGQFLMIDCNDLKIEFPWNQKLGTLFGAAPKRCHFDVCPTKTDALFGRSNRCSKSQFIQF